jgi:hypothetical protein
MASKSFSYGDVLGFGWNVMKKNFWFFVGVGAVLFLIALPSQVLANVMENYPEKIPFPVSLLLFVVTSVIEIITGIGFIKIALSFCDEQRPKFSTLFNAWDCFWRYIGTGILYGLIIAGAFIACVLPLTLLSGAIGVPCLAFVFLTVGFIIATILSIKFSLCFYFVIDKGLGPINALRASGRTTTGAKGSLFIFGILCSLINILGLLCLGVGLFATIPTVMVAMALVYRQLSAQTPELGELGINGCSAQLAPDVQSGPGIQPDTQRTKNSFWWLAGALGIIVIGMVITYCFWPPVKGTATSCKTLTKDTVASYKAATKGTVASSKTMAPLKKVGLKEPLELTAILYVDEPVAMVDGVIVREGDTINGAKVVKIYKDKVEFEKNGKKFTKQMN